MNQRIIYPNNEGGVSIIVPSANCGLTIEQIAAKDVPAGKPYKIVDVADIPSDRTFRGAWTVNEADLTDGVGAESNEFPVEEQA
jgi:hypothetical protein